MVERKFRHYAGIVGTPEEQSPERPDRGVVEIYPYLLLPEFLLEWGVLAGALPFRAGGMWVNTAAFSATISTQPS